MVGFRISRLAHLKKTMSQLKKLPKPDVIVMATFNFHPEQGISLLASSDDGRVLGTIRINVESMNRFICNRPCSLVVDINHLCNVLNRAGDEHSLRMFTSDSTNQYFFTIEDSVSAIVTYKKVKFTNGCHEFVLYKERFGAIIEGVKEDDHGSYVAKFDWKHLISLYDSICMTRTLWIYPSNGSGSPPVLMCPIDPNSNPNPIGNIIYYFL
ncbi:hypothetical protein QYF36_014076 [Acer negundo]|nr:hypothetical protein QYF36_014076 [Acer negundo]